MENKIIKVYNEQYIEEGGSWNKHSCLIDNTIETYSGPGSLLSNTDNLIENLPVFIKNYNIKSIIDIPCGDFNYMRKIINQDKNINYLGIDIAENAIKKCKKYETRNIKFKVDDITLSDITLNDADLIICKDLTLHLCFSDIKKVLKNIERSNCKYFACSRYENGNIVNKEQISGLGARGIEITKEPFNFNYEIIENIKYKSKDLQDELVIFKMN